MSSTPRGAEMKLPVPIIIKTIRALDVKRKKKKRKNIQLILRKRLYTHVSAENESHKPSSSKVWCKKKKQRSL